MSTIDKERMAVANEKFLKAILKGSLEAIMRAAHELFEAPVFAINAAGKFIYIIPNSVAGHSKWDSFVKNKVISFEETFRAQNYFEKNVSSSRTTLYLDKKKGYSGEKPSIMGRFYENNHIAGHIGILISPDYVPDETDMEIAELLCNILSSLYSNSVNYSANFVYNRYIIDLLKGNITDNDYRIFKMSLSPSFGGNFIVLVSPIPKIYSENSLASYITDTIAEKYNNILQAIFEDNIVIVCCHLSKSACKNPYSSAEIRDILKYLENNMLTTGISCGFSDIIHLKAYYEQARITAMVGTKINPSKKSYLFEEYIPFQMFYPISQLSLPEIFVHPFIMAMRDYDNKHNQDYLKTYKEYVYCGKDKQLAAEKLHIHVNTLNYRLNKINDLFHISQLDRQEEAHLVCSLVLIDLID